MRSSSVLAALLATGAVLGFARFGEAGPPNVKGKITGVEKLVVDVYAEAAKTDSRRWSWREPSVAVGAQFRNLSPVPSREIALVLTNNAKNPAPEQALLVRVTGGRTIPVTLVVQPEQKLLFRNDDPFGHTLAIVGQPGGIELPPGGRVEWKAPGGSQVVELREEAVPSLRSWVVIEPNAVQTVYPTNEGQFSFAVPAGEYFLRTYFLGKSIGKSVPVSAKERITLDLKDVAIGEGSGS